jgi:YesN/AraC family two-component response regulator
VLISGYEQFDYAQLALRYDIFDYLLKPLDDTVTKELMQRILKRLNEKYPRPGVGAQNNTLDAAMVYIEQHYMYDISLNDVAEQVFINKNYLSELFSRKLGVTFSQYKNSVRIRHACEMMDHGSWNMAEIAISVGFDSSSRFSKVFRQHMGMKPQEYRRGHVNEQE